MTTLTTVIVRIMKVTQTTIEDLGANLVYGPTRQMMYFVEIESINCPHNLVLKFMSAFWNVVIVVRRNIPSNHDLANFGWPSLPEAGELQALNNWGDGDTVTPGKSQDIIRLDRRNRLLEFLLISIWQEFVGI